MPLICSLRALEPHLKGNNLTCIFKPKCRTRIYQLLASTMIKVKFYRTMLRIGKSFGTTEQRGVCAMLLFRYLWPACAY